MSKVYISSFTNLDYEHLEKYGTLVREPMTVGFVDLTDLRKFYKKILPVLEQTTAEDYLALSGSAAVNVIVAHFWLNRHGMVRLLSFDKKLGPNGGYREIILTNTSLVPDDETKEDNT